MLNKKFIAIVLISAVIIVVTLAVLYLNLKTENNQVQRQAEDLLDKNGEFNSKSTDSQVTELKQALLFLAQEVGDIKNSEAGGDSSNTTSTYSRVSSPNISGNVNGSADLVIRLKALEDKVTALENKLSSSPAPSASTSGSNLKLQYIPLGINSETTDRNGIALDTYEISLDPADFPNYSNIQLEVVMKMSEAIGELSVSLYNFTDNVGINNSGITTHATNYGSYTSSGFRLASGRKTYRLWSKSSEGYLSYIQSARLKVNY